MCTVLVLLRPGERWPLLVATNRDERLERAFDLPDRYWPAVPGALAWRDRAGGGSWLGLNDDGVVATLVNAHDQLGPLAGKASRGELVVRALAERDAASAARTIGALPPARYRGFTLLVADRAQAFALSSDGAAVRVDALAPGHHMLTPEGCDVADAPRVRAYRDDLRAAPPPAPEAGDWESWTALLRREDADDPHHAMTVTTESGFGTVASTLIGIPAARGTAPALLVAPGPPTRVGYVPLDTKTRQT
jgi:hypothetical protein